MFGLRVVDQLERCFGSRVGTLTRRQARSDGSLTIRSREWPWSVAISVARGVRNRSRVEVHRQPSARRVLLPVLENLSQFGPAWSEERDPEFLASDIVWDLVPSLFEEFPSSAEYLPAERSGLLQGHRLLANAMLRQAPYAGLEKLEMPQMSGVITDFLSNILNINEAGSGDFISSADSLESQVLDGTIGITKHQQGYPEITYRQGKHAFPVHRVSSMVTEVAPIALYLRHLLKRGELFIVEEPESHLHPKNQLIVANAITRLFNEGLQLLVTTHSDYFLSALNNSVRRSALGQNAEGGGADQIDPSQLAAYGFQPHSHKGSRIHKLPISAVDGMDDQEFGRVTEQLYDATADLQEQLIRAEQ